MKKELIDVCLRQGDGDEQIIFNMGLDKETIDMMVKISKEDPKKWNNRDMDLFHEAVNRLEKQKRG